MPDPITPTGSQGLSPPAAALAAVQAASVQGAASPAAARVQATGGTTVESAEAKAIVEAAKATEAAQLDLSPAAKAGASGQPPQTMTMEEAAQAFQDYLKSLPSNLQFQPDYEAGIVVFKVVNPVTQKVIRQLPPEEVVQQVRNMRIAAKQEHSGILLDESL